MYKLFTILLVNFIYLFSSSALAEISINGSYKLNNDASFSNSGNNNIDVPVSDSIMIGASYGDGIGKSNFGYDVGVGYVTNREFKFQPFNAYTAYTLQAPSNVPVKLDGLEAHANLLYSISDKIYVLGGITYSSVAGDGKGDTNTLLFDDIADDAQPIVEITMNNAWQLGAGWNINKQLSAELLYQVYDVESKVEYDGSLFLSEESYTGNMSVYAINIKYSF